MRNMDDWQQRLFDDYGIKTVRGAEQARHLADQSDVLFVTKCSAAKGPTEKDKTYVQKDLYKGNANIQFYGIMEGLNHRYGTLSDKHGLLMDTDRIEPYDLHPSELSDDDFKELGQRIADRAASMNIKSIVFFNVSPIMSVPYFKMLKHTGLEVWYLTNIRAVLPITKKGLF